MQEKRIRASIEEQEEVSRFRALHRDRVSSTVISVDGYMEPSAARTTPTKRSLGGTVAREKKVALPKQPQWSGRGESNENCETTYEVPDDVFAFLSRSEQLKLRGRR